MFKIKNPIPQAIRDTTKVRNFYREWNLVPYAGSGSTSSHRYLKLLTDLYELSPTHGGCIDDLKFWCFEGELDVVQPLFGGRSRDIAESEKELFFDFIDSLGISDEQIVEQSGQLYLALKKAGTAYLHYREIRVGGTLRVQFEAVDPLDVMFLNTRPDEPRAVVISPDFYAGTFSEEEPPRMVRVYPDFSGTPRERETVFVIKNKRDHSDWYGRPDSLQAMFWMFVEWSIANLTAKTSQTEVTAKALLALENPDPNKLRKEDDAKKGIREVTLNVQKIGTNRGTFDEAESIGVITYPHGAKVPELLKLDINRDTNYLKQVTETASDYITSAHRWSKTLLGMRAAKANIGGNVLIDEFISRNTAAIKPTQRKFERSIWSNVFWEIARAAGRPEFEARTVRFEDKVESLITSLKNARENAIDRNGSSEPGQGEQQDPEV